MDEAIGPLIFGLLIGTIIGSTIGNSVTKSSYEKAAIAAGVATYENVNGYIKFEYKKPNND